MSRKPTRRDMIKGALGAGVAAGLGPRILFGQEPVAAGFPSRSENLIQIENAKPGTKDWQLTNTKVDPKTKYRCPWIEGYCSHTSIRAGETLKIMVSTNPVSKFRIDIYRLGYYQGLGGRLMQELGTFNGKTQPDPDVGEMRLRECKWEPSVKLKIPADWPSGVYVGKMTAEKDAMQSYVIFIVRDDRPCDFLFQCSDTTWQAYNRWPNQYSLYSWPDHLSKGTKRHSYTGPDVRASFDRPYGKYVQVTDAPLSQGSGSFLLFEFPIAFWMEKEGYDVSYISNVDTHVDSVKTMLRAKAFISTGHDEYWSRKMYDTMLAAVQGGMNLAFLSGDTCWGLIPFLASSSGVPNRIITRVGQFGPLEQIAADEYPEIKLFKKSAPTEAELIGVRNTFPYTGLADWICKDADHWIYENTGMKSGDRIKNLIGWEWMGKPADKKGLVVVAGGETRNGKETGEYAATIYPGPKNNWVFSASTIWWGDGLAAPPGYIAPTFKMSDKSGKHSPEGPDKRVQQITANLFNRFRGFA